jgi:hypothetical protein
MWRSGVNLADLGGFPEFSILSCKPDHVEITAGNWAFVPRKNEPEEFPDFLLEIS